MMNGPLVGMRSMFCTRYRPTSNTNGTTRAPKKRQTGVFSRRSTALSRVGSV
jgi:hypothetical protein